MNLYLLTAKKTLWVDSTQLLVAADNMVMAMGFLISGSDAAWVSVEKCELIGEFELPGYKTTEIAYPVISKMNLVKEEEE